MKNSEFDKNKFISLIINSIKMNLDDFMQNLSNGGKYESIIYEWSVNLFYEGKSIEEAIKTVYKRRMSIILNISYNSSSREEHISIRNHQRIMNELKSLPIYFNLGQKEKVSIQYSIDALIESKLRTHTEIIGFVTEIIKHNFHTNLSKGKTSNKPRKKFNYDNNETPFLVKLNNSIHPKTKLNEVSLSS